MPFLLKNIIGYPTSNAAGLSAVDITNIAQDTLCKVKNLGLFYYDKTSTATGNNLTVIAPSAGVGRWISTTGTYASSPLSLAKLTAPIVNATGDGTFLDVIFNATDINIGNYFNTSTGVFTAPISGTYVFNVVISLDNLDSSHTEFLAKFMITGINKPIFNLNPYAISNAGNLILVGGMSALLTAGNTCKLNIGIGGGTKTVSIDVNSNFSVYFLK